MAVTETYVFFSANNHALKGKRKTLTGQDVFGALDEMEFEHFIPELKKTLESKYAFFAHFEIMVVHVFSLSLLFQGTLS